jgi:AcrR family transcriptional regulator
MGDKTDKQEDLRIRRTRLLLQQAFTQLMTEKQFQSITVQEITDRAMVHRATFYDHFVDKYDLLEYAIREWFRRALERKIPTDVACTPENLDLLLRTCCEFLVFLSGQCVAKDKQIMAMVQTQITGQIQEIILIWINKLNLEVETPQLTAAVVSWAIYGAAMYWSQNPDAMPLTDFVAESRARILSPLGQTTQALAG